jgi:hypothetical protein
MKRFQQYFIWTAAEWLVARQENQPETAKLRAKRMAELCARARVLLKGDTF